MEEWVFSVTGRVQGVGYRAFVLHSIKDNSIGVKGHVRNTPDDSVEVRAQGEIKELELLYEYLKQGPRMSRVEKVLISKSRQLSPFEDFRIEL